MERFAFDNYVCVGDTSTITVAGYTLTARIEHDEDSNPKDWDECCTPEHFRAWEVGEWFYCGVVLSVAYNGIMLDEHAASLWAIEANIGEDNAYIAECANELVQEALEAGQKRRAETLALLS